MLLSKCYNSHCRLYFCSLFLVVISLFYSNCIHAFTFLPNISKKNVKHYMRQNLKQHVRSSVLSSSSSFVSRMMMSSSDNSLSSKNKNDTSDTSATSSSRPTDNDASSTSNNSESNDDDEKVIVVIGGGWAGFSAADALSTAQPKDMNSKNSKFRIDLLDASPRGPGGLASGWRSPILNRSVEAGLHGFWREYKNTFDTIENRIGLQLDDVLTPYTPSILVSQSGKVAVAPVLGTNDNDNDSSSTIEEILKDGTAIDITNPKSILSKVSNLLPPPLDVALLSDFDSENPLSISDRISAIGLLGCWADFNQEEKESWERYDKISADTLFRSTAGLSNTLYQELVSPLLHVLPMTPGYDCSAAAALSCFHVFALQSKGAFDVRWCRGTISEQIFNPWSTKLTTSSDRRNKVNISGSTKVTAINENDDETTTTSSSTKKYVVTVNRNGMEENINCDAIVMAVGGTAMKRLLPSCPPIASISGTDSWTQFRGVTCVAVRLFLQAADIDGIPSLPIYITNAMKESPVVVCGPKIGNIPQLTEAGFCIYDLQRLQDEFKMKSSLLENDDDNNNDKASKNPSCVALEVDFFRANDLADIDDNTEVAKIALQAVSAALDIQPIDPELLLDFSIVRAKDAVSHFCVNSASWSPDVRLDSGLYMCGDWIDRTGHASWSTEKSVVTARQAASALAEDFGMECDTNVIPAAPDTVQLETLRKLAKLLRTVTPTQLIPPAPWVLAKQITSGSNSF